MLLDSTTTASGGNAVLGFFFLILIFVAYFLPTFVAAGRHTTNAGGVFVINLFLGWTVLGWIIALAMAAGGTTKQQLEGRSAQPAPAVAPAAPVISPDGKSWWNGQRWQPLPTRELADERPELPPGPGKPPPPFLNDP
jgi:hypothetical protein